MLEGLLPSEFPRDGQTPASVNNLPSTFSAAKYSRAISRAALQCAE